MPYGSGLAAQLMIAPETTVGTQVTVTKAYELDADDGESVDKSVGLIEAAGLRAGQGYILAGRVRQSAFGVAGDITIPHVDRGIAATGGGMGLWWKHALGSTVTTPVQIAATTAYRQTHTPGFKTGLGLSVQVGRPQTDGVVRPFTWRGVKIVSWEFSCSVDGLAKLRVTIDGWQEDVATALAAATYPAGAVVFSFLDASTFTLGGTATTTGGRTTIAGGTPVASVVTGVTIAGNTPMAVDRRGLGSAGVKKEQLENDIPRITGTLASEFTSRTELYDLFASSANTALQLDFSQGDAGGGNAFRLSFVLPAIKLREAPVHADGPGILGENVNFEAFSDGTNPIIQVEVTSTDQAL
jgi:hypothetical protein